MVFQIQQDTGDIYLINSSIFLTNLDSVNITVVVEDNGVPALSSQSYDNNDSHE